MDSTTQAQRIEQALRARFGEDIPVPPDLPGLDDPEIAARVHTSDSIMRIDNLPASLVIVGGGVVAVEFAHIFASLGTKVTVLHRSERLLRRLDDTLVERFTDLFAADVNLRLRQRVVELAKTDRGTLLVGTLDPDGVSYDFETDAVLLATGRVSNADTLNLSATGVAVD